MQQSLPAPELPPRITIASLALIVVCLLSTAGLVAHAPTPADVGRDNVARRSDQRFAGIRKSLPQRGIIGYVGESGDSALVDYYLARYALAPLVIDRSPNHPLVAGNFPTSPPKPPPGDLELLEDFGNGVLLFTNPRYPDKDAP